MSNKKPLNDYESTPDKEYSKQQKRQSVKPSKVNGLTLKQRRFINNYKEGTTVGNGTRSAIKAGYSERSASAQSTALLKNPKVLAILNDNIEQAEGVILSLMTTGFDEKTRLAAAKDVLDRTVGKPIQRTESRSVVISVETMLSTNMD